MRVLMHAGIEPGANPTIPHIGADEGLDTDNIDTLLARVDIHAPEKIRRVAGFYTKKYRNKVVHK